MIRLILVFLSMSLALIACNAPDPETFDPTQSEYFAPTDRLIDLEGQAIRYRETGPADAPVILLLHGFTDSLHTWDELAGQLDQEFRIIRPDLPGHGLSGHPDDGDYSNEALVSFLADFMDANSLPSVTLVGNSLGGLTAWRYAAQSPDRVNGLILLAPGGVPHNGVTEEPLPVPAMLRFYLKNAPKAGVRAALESMHVDQSHVTDALVKQVQALMKTPGHGDGFVARAGSFTLPDPAEQLSTISVPTLLIWGTADNVLPAEHARTFSETVPQIETVILDDVGHMPQSEAAAEVADRIRAFVAQTNNPMSEKDGS